MDIYNRDIDQLIAKFRNYRIEEAQLADFDTLTPGNRTCALAAATANGGDCRHFLKSSEHLNIIRTAQGSSRAVSSGIRRYIRFSVVLGRRPFPPT